MTSSEKDVSQRQLQEAVKIESKKFETFYLWIEKHMPPSFFQELEHEDIILVTHALMNLDLQEFLSHISLKERALTLCLDSADADLRILEHYQMRGIKNYRSFVSNESPPFPETKSNLRIAVILFTEFVDKPVAIEKFLTAENKKEILEQIKARNPNATDIELDNLLSKMNTRFLHSLNKERLILALDMFLRAKTRDTCQYEVLLNKEWHAKKEMPSLRIVLAWRNVPKHKFLYQIAKVVHRHNLMITRSYATYIDSYSKENIFIMSLGLDGIHGKAAWDETNLNDFLQELVTSKYFVGGERIETTFVDSGLMRGNLGNLIKTMIDFVHQVLVHIDANLYSLSQIEEAFLRHPELTVQLTAAFEWKFHPDSHDLNKYQKIRESLLRNVAALDTGHEINDQRRKNVLKQAMHFIDFTLKTNFYKNNKTAFCFRLDPAYLDQAPFDRKEKFPELPFAIFFMKGFHYIGFHIRFKDLSRGGLRTVFPEKIEQMLIERNNVFAECYGLAYTQQKKNKDIPEGGAKAVVFLEPYEKDLSEEQIYRKELELASVPAEEIQKRLNTFHREQKLEYLYQAQRSYIECFMTLINCSPDGALKAKHVIDYYKKPEYIYLGPDENMHNDMIIWIAGYSQSVGYKPGGSFITSKLGAGINHKEYGVTSLGVNVCMEELLKFMGIDPLTQSFTVKISGGPDGDVAGNQIFNLYRFYPKSAKLTALIDVSGTIFDPEGLDLAEMTSLFKEGKPIRFYPPKKLSEGGFLLDVRSKKEQTAYAQQTLCYRKKNGEVVEDWISGNEMNHILRHNVHQAKTDIFIPCGGRPRTLNENNYTDFLDETGKPSSRAIVEGANLYLTPWARRSLEKLGVLIIKDSSANKGGVICSSFEVLCGLVLSEEEFLKEKNFLMPEILEIIRACAKNEAQLLLRTHQEKGAFLTDISEWISEKINNFMYQILDYLQSQPLSNDPQDPFIQCLLDYCPPLLRSRYQERILKDIPEIHKKAIIACYIASRLIYRKGLDWAPTIVDILPLVIQELAKKS